MPFPSRRRPAAADRAAVRIRDPADPRLAQDLRRGLAPRPARADARDRADPTRRRCSAARPTRRSPSTTPPARTPIRTRASTCAPACRRCARAGSTSAATPSCCRGLSSDFGRGREHDAEARRACASRQRAAAARAPRPAPTSPRCTTRAAASSRRRWNTSPSARTSASRRSATPRLLQPARRRVASAPASRSSSRPEFVRDEIARGRAIIPANINHPELRADDHRPQLPGEDQRQHRQHRGVAPASPRKSRSWSGRSAGAPTR